MIPDANFQTINLNSVLMVVAYLKDKQDSLLKDYITEFGRLDAEFAPLFKTDKILAPIDTSLKKIDLLDESRVSKPELGYIYKKKNSEKKHLFRARQ